MIQLHLKTRMKTSQILGAAILMLLLSATVLIISTFNQPGVSAEQLSTSALQAQVTLTPVAEDQSVSGSTDGIVVMGILIVVIITLPIVFRRKRK